MKTSEILREARNLLFEKGWTKGTFRDQFGALCARGAVQAASGIDPWLVTTRNTDYGTDAYWALTAAAVELDSDVADEREEGGCSIVQYNDRSDRTFDEIVALFDLAEKKALIAEEAN